MPTARQAVATLLTPPGRGGIAVIALAGADASAVLAETFQPHSTRVASEGGLQLGTLADETGTIDEAIVCRRGDAFEINLHGGPAATRATLRRLAACGANVAPSAFDDPALPHAHPQWNNPAIGCELLAALPQARGRSAMEMLCFQWAAGLSELAAGQPAADELRRATEGLATVRRLLTPAEVVLAGPPNAGKSTLANLLVGRAVSIVHDQPGTTRDWVREPAVLDGVAIWLTDTAGLWETDDQLDAQAVQRARQCIHEADLVVLMQAGAAPEIPPWLAADKVLTVASKADLAPLSGSPDVTLSALCEQGLAELRRAIVCRLGLADFDPPAPAAFTDRQADLLTRAADALDRNESPAARAALDELLGR